MSVIERILRVLKIQAERGLKTAVPPQHMEPKTVQKTLDELVTKYGADKESFPVQILQEYGRILKGDVDNQIRIAVGILLKNNRDAEMWCHLATMLKTKRDFKNAKVCFERALFLAPNHSDANYNYGNLLKELNDLDGAERQYRKCLQIDKNDFNARNNLGELLIAMKRPSEAEAELKKTIEIFPLHPKAHNNLGVLYFLQKDYKKAEEYFRKAIEIDPDYHKAKENLSQLLAVKILQKQGDSLSLRNCQTFGKAEIKGDGVKIGSIITDSAFSAVGGVNIRVKDLERYKDFRFDFEIEEGNAGGILEMNFLEEESSTSLLTYPFPIVDDYAKMTISGPIQPQSREKIDLSKIRIIQFVLRPVLPGRFESPLVWLRNFQLF